MKYYLGEIYVTQHKVLWWWVDYTERFSTTLIQGTVPHSSWLTCRRIATEALTPKTTTNGTEQA